MVLFNVGIGVPGNVESCVGRRYFTRVHYLALVCDSGVLSGRLQRRPARRNRDDPAWIADQVRFNQWFRENAAHTYPLVALVDTVGLSVETAE